MIRKFQELHDAGGVWKKKPEVRHTYSYTNCVSERAVEITVADSVYL